MKKLNFSATACVVASLFLGIPATQAEGPTPGYNNKIPNTITTPDRVETRIGSLSLYDGVSDKATQDKVFDNLDFIRGVDVFLNFIPATSIEGMRLGHLQLGADTSSKVLLFDKLMDSNPLFLTGNTDTVYASAMLDLEKDGATVIEIPPGAGPGTVNDAYFRFVVDMGVTRSGSKKGWHLCHFTAGIQG